ncbi:hypothetical protein LINGRAHAP2_LOCUS33824 [Linum grandiflorum]
MATSSKLCLYFIVSLLLLGAINAQIPYPPTGEACRTVEDCNNRGVYCVCDSGLCYCSAEKVLDHDHLLSKGMGDHQH